MWLALCATLTMTLIHADARTDRRVSHVILTYHDKDPNRAQSETQLSHNSAEARSVIFLDVDVIQGLEVHVQVQQILGTTEAHRGAQICMSVFPDM